MARAQTRSLSYFRSSTQRGRETMLSKLQLVKEKKGQRVKGPKVTVEGAPLNSNEDRFFCLPLCYSFLINFLGLVKNDANDFLYVSLQKRERRRTAFKKMDAV